MPISLLPSSLHTHDKLFKVLHGSWGLEPDSNRESWIPRHSGEHWCAFEPHGTAITHISPISRQTHTCSPAAGAASSSQKDTKGAWDLSTLQISEWTGRLLVVWRDRDSFLRLHSHPPCSSRVCPNPAVSWGYRAGRRNTRFTPTSAQLAQSSPLAVSEAMGRHKPLPTTRNMKHPWSQCVLERGGSHDNSTEAGERALGKLLPSRFWRAKGDDYKRDCSCVSYPCFSGCSLELFFTSSVEAVISEAGGWQFSISCKDLSHLANILSGPREYPLFWGFLVSYRSFHMNNMYHFPPLKLISLFFRMFLWGWLTEELHLLEMSKWQRSVDAGKEKIS